MAALFFNGRHLSTRMFNLGYYLAPAVSNLLKSPPSVLFFQSLLFNELGITQFLEDALLLTKIGQFFLFHDLDESLLKRLADEYLQHWFHFDVEIKQLTT